MIEPRHTDREYASELAELRERLLLMGARVEHMLRGSIRALVDRDRALAEHVIELDHRIDELELEIDARCLRILARWNPVASDLRFVTTAIKLVTHIERIGDLAESVSRHALELLKDERAFTLGPVLLKLGQAATELVRDALDAFVARDTRGAEAAVERDRGVDAYYAQFFPELLQIMIAEPTRFATLTRLQAIGKSFERIGDEATNIAEMVPFMVEGTNVRHRAGTGSS